MPETLQPNSEQLMSTEVNNQPEESRAKVMAKRSRFAGLRSLLPRYFGGGGEQKTAAPEPVPDVNPSAPETVSLDSFQPPEVVVGAGAEYVSVTTENTDTQTDSPETTAPADNPAETSTEALTPAQAAEQIRGFLNRYFPGKKLQPGLTLEQFDQVYNVMLQDYDRYADLSDAADELRYAIKEAAAATPAASEAQGLDAAVTPGSTTETIEQVNPPAQTTPETSQPEVASETTNLETTDAVSAGAPTETQPTAAVDAPTGERAPATSSETPTSESPAGAPTREFDFNDPAFQAQVDRLQAEYAGKFSTVAETAPSQAETQDPAQETQETQDQTPETSPDQQREQLERQIDALKQEFDQLRDYRHEIGEKLLAKNPDLERLINRGTHNPDMADLYQQAKKFCTRFLADITSVNADVRADVADNLEQTAEAFRQLLETASEARPQAAAENPDIQDSINNFNFLLGRLTIGAVSRRSVEAAGDDLRERLQPFGLQSSEARVIDAVIDQAESMIKDNIRKIMDGQHVDLDTLGAMRARIRGLTSDLGEAQDPLAAFLLDKIQSGPAHTLVSTELGNMQLYAQITRQMEQNRQDRKELKAQQLALDTRRAA